MHSKSAITRKSKVEHSVALAARLKMYDVDSGLEKKEVQLGFDFVKKTHCFCSFCRRVQLMFASDGGACGLTVVSIYFAEEVQVQSDEENFGATERKEADRCSHHGPESIQKQSQVCARYVREHTCIPSVLDCM